MSIFHVVRVLSSGRGRSGLSLAPLFKGPSAHTASAVDHDNVAHMLANVSPPPPRKTLFGNQMDCKSMLLTLL